MKLLNIDELVTPERAITIKGEQFIVKDKTVGQMLSALQAQQLIDDANSSPEALFEKMVDTVKQVIPDCPRETLLGLQMDQLNAILNFANTPIEDAAAEADEAREEEKKG